MGLILVGVGSIFVSYLWKSHLRGAQMDVWTEVPCQIETVSVDDTEVNQRGMPKYILEITYRYEFNDRKYLGNRIKRLSTEVSDPRKLKGKLEAYPVGAETVCYLDPDAPERVVLIKDSKAALYSIWFPCLFIVGGAGMVFSALFRKKA